MVASDPGLPRVSVSHETAATRSPTDFSINDLFACRNYFLQADCTCHLIELVKVKIAQEATISNPVDIA